MPDTKLQHLPHYSGSHPSRPAASLALSPLYPQNFLYFLPKFPGAFGVTSKHPPKSPRTYK